MDISKLSNLTREYERNIRIAIQKEIDEFYLKSGMYPTGITVYSGPVMQLGKNGPGPYYFSVDDVNLDIKI